MDIMKMMKQVQDMQSKAQAVQQELDALDVEGRSGGGLVRVTLTGRGTMRGVKIDPSLLKPDDAEMLEDLIIAAFKEARGKVDALMEDKMKAVTGGLALPPGLKPF